MDEGVLKKGLSHCQYGLPQETTLHIQKALRDSGYQAAGIELGRAPLAAVTGDQPGMLRMPLSSHTISRLHGCLTPKCPALWHESRSAASQKCGRGQSQRPWHSTAGSKRGRENVTQGRVGAGRRQKGGRGL